MSKIDEWVKRIRVMSKGKAHENVRAFDKDVRMTTTQAWRFRELQDGGFPAEPDTSRQAGDKAWYSLDEACDRLGCSADELLAEAADGRLHCFVEADRLRGTWDRGRAAPAGNPTHLVLPAAHCREIAANGSSNVVELEDRREKPFRRFKLAEIQWIDRAALRLAHPLPSRSGTGNR